MAGMAGMAGMSTGDPDDFYYTNRTCKTNPVGSITPHSALNPLSSLLSPLSSLRSSLFALHYPLSSFLSPLFNPCVLTIEYTSDVIV